MQKAMNQKWKNKNIKTNMPKDQVLKDHLEYSKNNSNRKKRSSHRNGKNRRKNKLRRTKAYNLIRLYNIKQEIENTTEDLEDFCESTSIKNQLKLDVTIF